MPDDDWALGQNEVDVRSESRNPLNAVEKSVALVQSIAGTEKQPCPVCGGGWWYERGEIVYAVHGKDCPFIDANEATVYACRNPEQAWIDESRAEAEREDIDNEERTGASSC